MPTQLCTDCGVKVPKPVYRRCAVCCEAAIFSKGELTLSAESASNYYEKYEVVDRDTVYATFYRIERYGELLFIKTDERKWCLKINFYKGFPCAPRLEFVSPYNYKDGCPTWWPKTKFYTDPLRKILDLTYVDERTAHKSGVSRGRLDLLRPKTEEQFLTSRASKQQTYRDYLSAFWDRKKTLEYGTDAEVDPMLRKWRPDYYVGVIAPQILPPAI